MRPIFPLPALLITLLAALLALAGCSDPAPSYALDPTARPALWEIADGNGTPRGYLFGTVHLLPKGVDWHSAKLDAAIARSDALVTEVLGADDPHKLRAAFKALAFSPDLPPVEDRLPADLKDELEEARKGTGLAGFSLNGMESWAVALTLGSAQNDTLGLVREQGVETGLQARFRKANKPIRGLETLTEQLGAFDGLPEPEQRLMLREVVAQDHDVRAEFEALLQAWAGGDEAALVEASQGGLMEAPRIREAILVARNRAWARRIDTMLKRGERPFVAVGAGHLVGPDNVRELLTKAGYEVKRVQ